jgi:hypothetical protein
MNFITYARVSLFLAHFYKLISNVMHISLNKQHVSFQNCFRVLSWLLVEKGHKAFSLFKFLRRQHNTGQIQVERAWPKLTPPLEVKGPVLAFQLFVSYVGMVSLRTGHHIVLRG